MQDSITDKIKQISNQVLEIILHEDRPIPRHILFNKICHSFDFYVENSDFNIAIDNLLKLGNIKKNNKNGYLIAGYINGKIDDSKTYQGIISINSILNGFIKLVTNNETITFFVHRSNLNNALNGDLVEFKKMETRAKSLLKHAIVTKIIKHNKNNYVATFNSELGKEWIHLDDSKNYLNVVLNDSSGLVDGQKILINICKYENDKAYANVLKIIGKKSDPGIDILSIAIDAGINPEFDNDVLKESSNLKLEINDKQLSLRKDLTKLPIITIDPATSKDFDDAFYVEKLKNNNYKLYVCIADVAHYVKFKSKLDDIALQRGCSLYLINKVIPMLPNILSDDICSLNPNVDRFCLTAEIIFDCNGKIIDYLVYPSIINNHQRLNYDEVNDFFNNNNDDITKDEAIKKSLLLGKELSKILDENRTNRGYIDFNIPEPKIILDENGSPIEIKLSEHGEAQNMIENFMLHANEVVTLFAQKNKLPFIYRIHEKPNDEKIKSLLIETKKINFKINTDLTNIKPIDISHWLKDNYGNENIDLINMLLLKTMSKAKYSTKNIGHFGLALKNYTHFTSPIRRYPDLIVGRLFWMFIFDRNSYSDEERKMLINNLNEFCIKSSDAEILAIDCERNVNSMKFAEYMGKHIGEKYCGVISGITKMGIYVQLENTITGFINMHNLGNDYYQYNENINEMIGKNTRQTFSLGTKIIIEVVNANKELQKIDFKFIKYLNNN